MTDPTRQPGARDLTRVDTDPTDRAADRLVPEADLAETATEPLPEPEGPTEIIETPYEIGQDNVSHALTLEFDIHKVVFIVSAAVIALFTVGTLIGQILTAQPNLVFSKAEPTGTLADGSNDDDDDDANTVLVQQLQKQISELEGTLETLENGKNKNPLLITSTRVALNSVQAALAGAMSVAGMSKRKGKKRSNPSSSSSASEKKSKSQADKKRKSPAAKKPRTSSTTSPTPRRRNVGSDEDDVRTVTFDQKEELAAKITELSDERLEGAIRIINEDKPHGTQGTEDEEIELDIDELSPQTLYKLYKYVVRPKKKSSGPDIGPNGKPMPASAPIDGRKRGTGGLKKKNLDEEEEAARIARLQHQLQQFNDASSSSDAPKSASGSAAAPSEPDSATKHDDLVPSESSSNEDEDDDGRNDSESDSESDMD